MMLVLVIFDDAMMSDNDDKDGNDALKGSFWEIYDYCSDIQEGSLVQFGAVKNPNILKVVFDNAYRKVALFYIFITLQRKIKIPMFSEKTNLSP